MQGGLVATAALLHVCLWLTTLVLAWYVYVDIDKAGETLRASGRLFHVAACMSTAALGCTVIAASICISCVHWKLAIYLRSSVAGPLGMIAAFLASAAQLIALLCYVQGLVLYAVYEAKMSDLTGWTPFYQFDNAASLSGAIPSGTVERLVGNSTLAFAFHTMATMRLLTCVFSYKETYDLSICCNSFPVGGVSYVHLTSLNFLTEAAKVAVGHPVEDGDGGEGGVGYEGK